MKRIRLAVAALAVTATPFAGSMSRGEIITEIEPNEFKATATFATNAQGWGASGDRLTGRTTGNTTTLGDPTSRDIFLIQTAPAALAIYRHRLVITTAGTVGHTGTIRGIPQSGVPTDNIAVQTSSGATSVPAEYRRTNQWYGFGRAEMLYWGITGTVATAEDYVATLETVPVTPVDIGPFIAGDITISTAIDGAVTNTDVILYDAGFNVLSVVDDNGPVGHASRSVITRNLTAGTYYLAISEFDASLSQANDPGAGTAGNRWDFPNGISRSTFNVNRDIRFSVIDAAGPATFSPLILPNPMEIYWARMTVVPEPASLLILMVGIGGAAWMRRGRR